MSEKTVTYTQCDTCGVMLWCSAEQAVDEHGWTVDEFDAHHCPPCMEVAADLEAQTATTEEVEGMAKAINKALKQAEQQWAAPAPSVKLKRR